MLLSPAGSPHPFYAEFGWVRGAGATLKVPDRNTVWTQQGSGTLGVGRPVTLTWDNGEGLEFRRIFTVDDKYLITVENQVVNQGSAPVTLYPYGLIRRHGTPETLGYYILHEGLIGVFGDQGLQEFTYADIEDKKTMSFKATNAWLGITDKYWAATLLARHQGCDPGAVLLRPRSARRRPTRPTISARPQTVAPGATASRHHAAVRRRQGGRDVGRRLRQAASRLVNRFELLIDWGWFHFITKPMFIAIDWLYHYVGNFGIAILLITVIIKFIFFPLANKSYASMAKMKAVQPEMMAIRERYGDDKMKQQQALMELYKKEKINPLAGCLPILVQVPVFFALYKVLFISIEMRHAPFYRLDQGPLGARPDQPVQPVRADPVRSDADSGVRPVPAPRLLADHHGHHDVDPDEAQSGAAGPDAEDDLRLDAADLHLHAGVVLGRPGDLLGLEQHAVGAPAERHHAQARRQDRAVRQRQGMFGKKTDEQRRSAADKPRIIPRLSCPAKAGHPVCTRAFIWIARLRAAMTGDGSTPAAPADCP